MRIRHAFERGLAQWLGWRSPPAHRFATSWPDPWADRWCRRCGGGAAEGSVLVGCLRCRLKSMPWAAVARLGRWTDLAEPIAALKFRRRWDVGLHLEKRLSEVLRIEHGGLLDNAVAVVLVPMPRWRRVRRGVDHAAVIAGTSKLHLLSGAGAATRWESSPSGPVPSGQIAGANPWISVDHCRAPTPRGHPDRG